MYQPPLNPFTTELYPTNYEEMRYVMLKFNFKIFFPTSLSSVQVQGRTLLLEARSLKEHGNYCEERLSLLSPWECEGLFFTTANHLLA